MKRMDDTASFFLVFVAFLCWAFNWPCVSECKVAVTWWFVLKVRPRRSSDMYHVNIYSYWSFGWGVSLRAGWWGGDKSLIRACLYGKLEKSVDGTPFPPIMNGGILRTFLLVRVIRRFLRDDFFWNIDWISLIYKFNDWGFWDWFLDLTN